MIFYLPFRSGNKKGTNTLWKDPNNERQLGTKRLSRVDLVGILPHSERKHRPTSKGRYPQSSHIVSTWYGRSKYMIKPFFGSIADIMKCAKLLKMKLQTTERVGKLPYRKLCELFEKVVYLILANYECCLIIIVIKKKKRKEKERKNWNFDY